MSRPQQRLESLGRMLTYILSHRPDEFGLVLNAEGWLPIKHLLQVLAEEPGWGFVRRSHLLDAVHLLTPPRFEIYDNLIRCRPPGGAACRSQESEWPPSLLYRAITRKSHPVVAQHGLRPPTNGHLVLARGPEMALRMGRRRDPKAMLITVQAQAAAAAGKLFFPYGEKLFLTDAIPPNFLQVPPCPKPEAKKPPPKPAALEKNRRELVIPGSVLLDIQGKPVNRRQEKRRKQGPEWKEQARAERRQRRRQR
ncbi:MAG: RNA 2'-phosphotransferase [Deltaproteobacteria bacterium]|nr:RNA 2'-phosphotransferase [Deltaproteobacteria bacterium]MBW1985731.1 RNA 2'-phosphotransferase [Deltaproteobacteria bacterium]MBW2134644.1 RNA 2'-phosphotransferase [Deltaproteobacteria bacterium]